MTKRGLDSATEPTLAQARAAKAAGYQFWAFYVQGPGAAHNWSVAGTEALKGAGLSPLPIYVPAMTGGRIALPMNPQADAEAFVAAYRARGLDGAAALDTEASMRGFPETAEYTQTFCQTLRGLGQKDICYAGGFTIGSPPASTYKWWIGLGTDPIADEMIQQGGGVEVGVLVDFDFAGDDFPLALFDTALYPKPSTTTHALLQEANGDWRATCPYCHHTYDVSPPD